MLLQCLVNLVKCFAFLSVFTLLFAGDDKKEAAAKKHISRIPFIYATSAAPGVPEHIDSLLAGIDSGVTINGSDQIFSDPMTALFAGLFKLALPQLLNSMREASEQAKQQVEILVLNPRIHSDSQIHQSSKQILGMPQDKFLEMMSAPFLLTVSEESLSAYFEDMKLLKLMNLLNTDDEFKDQIETITKSLTEAIGPVRTAYILDNLDHLSEVQLLKIVGLKVPEKLLVLRRFGYVSTDQLHYLIPDSAYPYVPGFVPPSFQDDFDNTVHFMNEKELRSLLIAWGEYSNNFHSLSESELRAEKEKGKRPAITDDLLSMLHDENVALDVMRAFFIQVEDYDTEKVLGSFAIIDANLRNGVRYHPPVFRRLLEANPALDFQNLFDGELYEFHGLARSSEHFNEIPFESLLLAMAAHIEDAGLMNANFIGQTDKVGFRLYKRFGFTENKTLSALLSENEAFISVKGSVFVEKVREIYPMKGRIHASLPNHATKRLANPEMDAHCAKLLLNID